MAKEESGVQERGTIPTSFPCAYSTSPHAAVYNPHQFVNCINIYACLHQPLAQNDTVTKDRMVKRRESLPVSLICTQKANSAFQKWGLSSVQRHNLPHPLPSLSCLLRLNRLTLGNFLTCKPLTKKRRGRRKKASFLCIYSCPSCISVPSQSFHTITNQESKNKYCCKRFLKCIPLIIKALRLQFLLRFKRKHTPTKQQSHEPLTISQSGTLSLNVSHRSSCSI